MKNLANKIINLNQVRDEKESRAGMSNTQYFVYELIEHRHFSLKELSQKTGVKMRTLERYYTLESIRPSRKVFDSLLKFYCGAIIGQVHSTAYQDTIRPRVVAQTTAIC